MTTRPRQQTSVVIGGVDDRSLELGNAQRLQGEHRARGARLPYNTIPIDIGAGDQFAPEFLSVNPNNKIPAIIDHEGPGGGSYALIEKV